jgi:two-component system OmpR family response regulator
MHLLLVEDDARVADFVAKGLREAGHSVDHIADGRDGLYAAAAESYDVIILDRMLPHVDGLTIVQTMRAAGNKVPVLILSALGEIDDRVEGLRKGGDDYLSKPFAMSELLARVEALGRRAMPLAERTNLRIADIDIDLDARRVRKGGVPVDLTPREFRILEYLARNSGRVVTRSMLLEAVWDYRFDPQTNIVDQHVSRLRSKIVEAGGLPSPIETVRGAGYMIRPPERE